MINQNSLPQVSYSFYYNSYCGSAPGVIPEESFPRFADRARSNLAAVICGGVSLEPLENEVKCAICACAEVLYENSVSGLVKTENTDGYSVTYRDAAPLTGEIYRAAAVYLAGSGVMFAGVEEC